MKQHWKKLAALVLSVVMVTSLLPGLVFAAEGQKLTLGERMTVSNEGEDGVTLEFTPEETGLYEFESFADDDLDPFADLYDSEDTFLANADDETDRNFKLVYQLNAGEVYRIKIDVYDETPFSFDIMVSKSKMESVSVDPITIVENTCGYEYTAYDDNNQSKSYYLYEPLTAPNVNATVVYDGTSFSGSWEEVYSFLEETAGDAFYRVTSEPEQYDTPWTVGNTYDIEVNLCGVTCKTTVSIVPSPIENLKISDTEVLEGSCGYSDYDYDAEQSFYRYDPVQMDTDVSFTYQGQEYNTKLNQLTTVVEDLTGDYYSLETLTRQSYETRWTGGNSYDCTVRICGAEATFKVAVKALPLTLFEAEDVVVSEGAYTIRTYRDGGEPLDQYQFSQFAKLKIVYDGETYTGSLDEIRNILREKTGSYPSVDTYSPQWNTNWEVGKTYPAQISLLGKTAEFNVTIKEGPFASVKAEDTSIIYHTEGYIAGPDREKDPFRYVYYPNITLTTKDGKTISVSNGQRAEYNGEKFPMYLTDDQSGDKEWGIGEHQCTVQISSVSAAGKVQIVESPVKELKMEPLDVYEGLETQLYIPHNQKFTITFKDGTQASGRESYTYQGKDYYLDLPLMMTDLSWKAGTVQQLPVSLLGCDATWTLNVLGIDSISISGDETLQMTVKQTDGKTGVHQVKFYQPTAGRGGPKGYLYTDKGNYLISLNYDSDYSNVSFTLGEKTSNTIASSKWLKTNMDASPYFRMTSIFANGLAGIDFSGKATKDNIDAMIDAALINRMYNGHKIDDYTETIVDGQYRGKIKAATIKKYITDIFAVSDLDMTLSSRYDKNDDTVYTTIMGIGFSAPDITVVYSKDNRGFTWAEGSNGGSAGTLYINDQNKISYINSGSTSVTGIFDDVNEGDWFVDAVSFAYNYKNAKGVRLMSGYDGGKNFGPADPLARAQFAVMLYRFENEPPNEGDDVTFTHFVDVPLRSWYMQAVNWAYRHKIISGYNDGRFGPADNITREQLATILYRYANLKKYDTSAKGDLSKFKDAGKVSGFAKDALTWAAGVGIITGKDNGTRIDPQGNAVRAECAAMFQRFITWVEQQ